jgi:hypothetical protein
MCYPRIHGVPGLIRSAQRQITAINLRHRVDYRLTPAYNIRANRLNSGLTSSPFHTTAHLERPACLLPLWPASISPIVTTCHTNRVEECCPLQLLCAVDREVCLRLSIHLPQPFLATGVLVARPSGVTKPWVWRNGSRRCETPLCGLRGESFTGGDFTVSERIPYSPTARDTHRYASDTVMYSAIWAGTARGLNLWIGDTCDSSLYVLSKK